MEKDFFGRGGRVIFRHQMIIEQLKDPRVVAVRSLIGRV